MTDPRGIIIVLCTNRVMVDYTLLRRTNTIERIHVGINYIDVSAQYISISKTYRPTTYNTSVSSCETSSSVAENPRDASCR